jgi:hypothetical protein
VVDLRDLAHALDFDAEGLNENVGHLHRRPASIQPWLPIPS